MENKFLPTISHRYPNQRVKFIQDRYPIHTSRVVQRWFRLHDQQIELLPWPPKGADLNPIENVWGDIVQLFESRPLSRDQVFDQAKSAWERLNLRTDYFKKLSDSMPDRLMAVIEAGGQWIRY